jgi:ketosteroid isomerase-like protein
VSGHPNAERLLRGFGAFVQRDLDALHELFADGVRWTIPGGSALGGTYTTTLSFVLADDEHAVAAYRATGSRDGHELDVEQLLVCRFQGERIAEVQALPFDQAVFDAFWA